MTTRGSSRTPPVPSPSTGATCCPAGTTTGCSRPGRSSSASAWTCATCLCGAGADGRPGRGGGCARRRIQLQPLEEVGYRTLMRLQADLGDRAGAVSTYHHCASVLERELGVVPDPATRQAFQRLMAHADPAGAKLPAVTACRPAAPGWPRRSSSAGRPSSACSRTLWRTAAAGRPGLALVRGGAGVGKTRLVAEVAEMARLQGAVVASTQCFGTSGRLALAPVADWLRNPAVQSAAAALDPAWRAEVGRLVPSGEGRGEPGAGSRAMADAWQRHRFFEGLARALMAVGRPMLLVLDNMQWCDQETLAFLTFCLGWPAAPLLVAGTLRDDDLDEDPELADWTVRMRATGLLTELSLGPLDAADTARLAEAISGQPLPEADADLLQATTGGFPLYVIEAVRSTVDLGGRRCRRRSHGGAAQAARAGDRGGPGGGRPGGGGRGRTSPWTCSPRRATSTPTSSWRRSTSCGGAGSCASSVTATTSPTTCSAKRRTRRSARRSAGCCTGASPRASSCSTPTTPTRSRPSSPSSMPAAGGPSGRWPTTGARPMSRRGMFAHAEAIRLHKQALSIVGTCPRGGTGTGRNSRSSRRWRRRSTPGTATRPRSCSGRSSARSPSPSHLAARTRRSPAWSRCGRRGSSRGAPPTGTRRPPARWPWSTPAPS